MWGFSACLLRWLVGSDPGCVASPAQNCHSFLRPAVSHPASSCQRISLKISQSVLGKRLASRSMFPHMWNAKLGSKLRWSKIKSYSPLSALAQIDSMSIPDCWRRSLKKEKRWKKESFIMPAIWPLLRMFFSGDTQVSSQLVFIGFCNMCNKFYDSFSSCRIDKAKNRTARLVI